jgi:hypothetical protein
MINDENSWSDSNIPRSSANNTILSFSPIKSLTSKQSKAPIHTNNDVLVCAKFQENLVLTFGNVLVKSTNVLQFKLSNPDTSKTITIAVESNSNKSEIIVSLGNNSETDIVIPPSSVFVGSAYWTPSCDCTLREVVRLRLDGKAPLQIVFQGVAGSGKVIL